MRAGVDGTAVELLTVPTRRLLPAFAAALLTTAALLLGTVPVAPPASAAGMIVEHVRIPMPDGVTLAGVVARPDVSGKRFPVVVQYDPYGVGSAAENSPPSADFLVPEGYVHLGVSIRGTGCSEGSYDQVFSAQEAEDGAHVIEWAAQQPWSTGKVGMMGWSYPGIVQFMVAAEQPDGLAAIAPFETLGDLYRDAFYPGGIFNDAFGLGWTLGFQQLNSLRFSAGENAALLSEGDPSCARNQAASLPGWIADNAGPYAATHPHDGHFYASRSPRTVMDRIEVPVFMADAWQDEQVGSRGLFLYDLIETEKKLTVVNGIHGDPRNTPFVQDQLVRWFDRWLKGERNGVLREPAVTVLLDLDAERVPGQVIRSESYPLEDTSFTRLYLRTDKRLLFSPPRPAEPADEYAYPGTQSVAPYYGLPAAGALHYQTPPLEHDLVVAGPAELVLYAQTTAPDTDWFVTLSEVAPDGSVTHIQKGMLRASHRRVDPERSRPGRPFHTHRVSEPVPVGETVRYRVEILPFAHAFRAGSSIRLDFLTPSALPEPWWGYVMTPVPSVNTVRHSRTTPSHLLLPVVDAPVDSPRPPCGANLGQPCRASSPLERQPQ